MAEAGKTQFSVQVRELVEFVLRRGDLGGPREFVGTDRALAGIRGHQKIQRSRPAGYRKEVPARLAVDAGEFRLEIRGRIDGVAGSGEEPVLEEIKTVTGSGDGSADPLHWAQLKCYGHMYCVEHGCRRVELRLVYLQLETGRVVELSESWEAVKLEEFFSETVRVYADWLGEHRRWLELRDESARGLVFPFPRYRAGQRELAVAAYRAMANGERLFVEAPTGIGKTISVLFPAVKALAESRLERIFYLTARTVGRTVAESAVADLRRVGLRLRCLTLTAKEKICFQAGAPCDPAQCPFAKGYYDRLHAGLRAALQRETITRPVVEEIGRVFQLCPFEFALDLSLWADTVICDYNYVFDPKVYLRRHFEETVECVFLVDEAHNLADRGREMFSAELSAQSIRTAKRALGKALPKCSRALGKVLTALRRSAVSESTDDLDESSEDAAGELNLFPSTRQADGTSPQPAPAAAARRDGTTVLRQAPPELLEAVDAASQEVERWLARNEPAPFREPLLELFFELHSFQRTAAAYGADFVTLVRPGPAARARLYCLDPSRLLGEALQRGRSAVFFSATLSPIEYYRDVLGGAAADKTLLLSSPFPPENLAVLVQDRIPTRYRDRDATLQEVAGEVAAVVGARGGNYMVYLPSYAYLQALYQAVAALAPDADLLAQTPGMSETERERFLAEFRVERARSLVGFAVMGGVFGEGIDLVGERLIGAIVVGVGLPQLCIDRDVIRDHFQAAKGAGFDYAYRFPGMNRVLQATGRVIRSETDRGVVLLIDTRFGERRYLGLLPSWWRPRRVGGRAELCGKLARFWSGAAT